MTAPSSLPSVTIGICTWNRSDLLQRTLEEMTHLRVPSGLAWEILVVNNNCTDDTDQVIQAFTERLPVRRLFESTPGKSHAANRLVAEARGEYIIWTDDDVLVYADWLTGYLDAFARWPEATVFGGPIEPWFVAPVPPWLQRTFPLVANAYAALDHGPEAIPLTMERYPYGANMAFRRSAHLRRPYDTRLGPRPNSGIRGEELILTRQVLSDGDTGWWVPGARVKHYIPPHRMSLRYLKEYFYGGGQALGLVGRDDRGELKAFGRPLWLWKQALTSELRYRWGRITAPPERWIESFKMAALSWGQIKSYASQP
jgi:glycosyltransferase involved in cell wall biosynthesis